ncbi:MAG: Gfo/Idh/MocA family oxidoreductase [Lentimicrobiaceae bacterium]|nr:Gfo/Idh/MocA family oxidoreductase [Lentimicrobiaceae bacterium]
MENKKIRIGIIGFGRMGITHYSIINTHPDIQIVAVADTSKTILNILKKLNKELNVFTDYKELIDVTQPDAIIISTPPNLHYPIIKYAYEKKIHIFCEKPFTANLKQADELTNIFSNSNLVNQIGFAARYGDVLNKAKELIDNKVIGDIIRFKGEMFSCAIIKKTNGTNWRDQEENGGGVVYEMGTHMVDLINYFFGEPDKVAGTVRSKVFSKNVDDIVSTTFIYKNGLTGTMYINWSDESYRKSSVSIEVFGSKGKIIADFYGYKLFLSKGNNELNLRKGWNTFHFTDVYKPVPFYVRGNEFSRQLYDFVGLISGSHKTNLCDFAEAYKTERIIDLIFKDSLINNN